jgi:hypothetical protein
VFSSYLIDIAPSFPTKEVRKKPGTVHDWPGERFGHRWLLDRVWELRDSVRGWDAFYVALAEAFDATLLTLDARLARAHGTTCRIEVVGNSG